VAFEPFRTVINMLVIIKHGSSLWPQEKCPTWTGISSWISSGTLYSVFYARLDYFSVYA
jgi:hypothetical protein